VQPYGCEKPSRISRKKFFSLYMCQLLDLYILIYNTLYKLITELYWNKLYYTDDNMIDITDWSYKSKRTAVCCFYLCLPVRHTGRRTQKAEPVLGTAVYLYIHYKIRATLKHALHYSQTHASKCTDTFEIMKFNSPIR